MSKDGVLEFHITGDKVAAAARDLGVPPPEPDEMHIAVWYTSLRDRDRYAELNRKEYGHRVNTGLLLRGERWTPAAVITVQVPAPEEFR